MTLSYITLFCFGQFLDIIIYVVAEFSVEGKREIRRFRSWVILGEGKQYQEYGFIGKAMGKYAEALEMNADMNVLMNG